MSDPVALIECYCFQSNFYANYDLLSDRKIEDVNKIGARIGGKLFPKCKAVTKGTKNLCIFEYDLDGFLKLNDKTRNYHIKELNQRTIKKLLEIKGIGLSTATKVLHTLYPKIIPMIDRALQEEYRKEISPQWTEEQSDQILIDYYNNLREDDNLQHLTQIFDIISKNNLVGLTKVRIFDILWWSYLKSKKLRQKGNINWCTIK
ncbi:unnamed protein product [marine sediment metagenome]|uniref:Uncharacterized protein n=1 Tax=marine sediment metagenome TaxID=412755 RepID=X0YTS5_9ZZZZ